MESLDTISRSSLGLTFDWHRLVRRGCWDMHPAPPLWIEGVPPKADVVVAILRYRPDLGHGRRGVGDVRQDVQHLHVASSTFKFNPAWTLAAVPFGLPEVVLGRAVWSACAACRRRCVVPVVPVGSRAWVFRVGCGSMRHDARCGGAACFAALMRMPERRASAYMGHTRRCRRLLLRFSLARGLQSFARTRQVLCRPGKRPRSGARWLGTEASH